jgi:hypothetical protein
MFEKGGANSNSAIIMLAVLIMSTDKNFIKTNIKCPILQWPSLLIQPFTDYCQGVVSWNSSNSESHT